MSLDDAHELEASLKADNRVLIVGAGLIGLKCAEALAHRVEHVTVCDLADHILPSILDQEGAALVQAHLEKEGICFKLASGLSRIEGHTAIFADGYEEHFDRLGIAVGVKPNVELVQKAGGEVNRGIAVESCGETTLKDMYAAGDCVESFDISSDTERILALLPLAYQEGECAGVNMAGGEMCYDKAIPMNAIGFYGLHILTSCSYEGAVETFETEGCYNKLFTKDGLLKGFILIGHFARAGIYTPLICDRVKLTDVN